MLSRCLSLPFCTRCSTETLLNVSGRLAALVPRISSSKFRVPEAELTTIYGHHPPGLISASPDGKFIAILVNAGRLELRPIHHDGGLGEPKTVSVPEDAWPHWSRLVWDENSSLLALVSSGADVVLISAKKGVVLVHAVESKRVLEPTQPIWVPGAPAGAVFVKPGKSWRGKLQAS